MQLMMYVSKKQQTIYLISCTIMMFYIVILQVGILNKLQSMDRRPGFSIILDKLVEALQEEKGTGCNIPPLNPFAKEIMKFDGKMTKIECNLQDWVRCNFSKCSIEPEILSSLGDDDLNCTLRDILYITDKKYSLGPPTVIKGRQIYILRQSDHVSIKCTRTMKNETVNGSSSNTYMYWEGLGIGFRPVIPIKTPLGKENTPNVLIFAFDSASRNGFIRKMPKSYKFITEQLGAVVLKKYNIVGDGTTQNIFPLLTGITLLEHPECRISFKNSGYVNEKLFVFSKAKEQGYRTAYFEDVSSGGEPLGGTFQFYLNGFRHQPSDHYLRNAFDEELKIRNRTNDAMGSYNCFGGTPRFKIMMNLTAQFFKLNGKRFAFTFISDISHDDFNTITNADEPLVEFLNGLKQDRRLKDTLLIVMGDHGSRFSDIRQMYQGKLEERLPFMAIRLPDDFVSRRPEAALNLKINADTLTTPHDIHSTLLDVIDMKEHWIDYKIKGADLKRGLTLLEKIPQNRSCSEAGVLPHWCTCMRWKTVQPTDPVFNRLAKTLVHHINSITRFQRMKCAKRSLSSVMWVMKQTLNQIILEKFPNEPMENKTHVAYGKLVPHEQLYQIKITVDPGDSAYEATVTHHVETDKFHINTSDISRTNAYKLEPACVSATYPDLNKYCYCK